MFVNMCELILTTNIDTDIVFSDNVSILAYAVSNEYVTSEWWIERDVGVSIRPHLRSQANISVVGDWHRQ
jgi:hypothetical protein